jgi:hypothetical protein
LYVSYQVPKEVGKVGVESRAFIEPVATRKDGIKAMFEKQRSKQEGGMKRKRSASPVRVAGEKEVKLG